MNGRVTPDGWQHLPGYHRSEGWANELCAIWNGRGDGFEYRAVFHVRQGRASGSWRVRRRRIQEEAA